MFSFVNTALDSDTPDSEAVMILRDGRLLAVASCLSLMHGALEGRWYIEASFRTLPYLSDTTFETLSKLEAWLEAMES
jgi:hypothetical protein